MRKKGFFTPLVAFVFGMLLLALSTIFYPAIMGQANSSSAAIGSAVASHYWGLSWGLGSVRLLLFLIGLLSILITVAVVWLRRKWGRQ